MSAWLSRTLFLRMNFEVFVERRFFVNGLIAHLKNGLKCACTNARIVMSFAVVHDVSIVKLRNFFRPKKVLAFAYPTQHLALSESNCQMLPPVHWGLDLLLA
jgi:hypothetical protein